MKKRLDQFAIVTYVLFVMGAITFGATQLHAASPMDDCPYNGWSQLGYCIDAHDCDIMCNYYNNSTYGGRCSASHCCTCYL